MVALSKAEAFKLFHEVDRFYDNEQNFRTLIGCITNSRRTVSLTVIDYFVRIYAYRYNVTVPVDGVHRSVIKIFRNGKWTYGRKFYNVFKRSKSFQYTKHGLSVRVTLGQLAMFRDVIRYNMLEYIQLHHDEIVANMNRDNDGADRSACLYNKAKCHATREPAVDQYTEYVESAILSVPLVSIIPPPQPQFYQNPYFSSSQLPTPSPFL